MNRTIKDATIKALHYPDFATLKAHALAFVMAYNSDRHLLNALRWRTPFKVICEAQTKVQSDSLSILTISFRDRTSTGCL